jgi:flagellar assembly factor FliW
VKVATKPYGLIDIDERQKIVFPQGLFGFEMYTDYVLMDAERQPYYWLQAMDSQGAAFILISPFLFRPDYEVNIGNDELSCIGLDKAENALVFAIATVPPDGPMTANLQGPLIINRDSRMGRQVILTDPRWKTRHNVMEELAVAKATGVAKAAGAKKGSC